MNGMHSGPIPVLDYNENWSLFSYKSERVLLHDDVFPYSMEELDKKNSPHLSSAELKHLEEVAGNLRITWMKFLAETTDCFEWRELINTLPFVHGNPPSKYRNQELPFFLGSSAIVMDTERDDYFLVMHSHAAAAFGEKKYIKAAEKYLEDFLRQVDIYRPGEKIYGVLMIGGKVSFYERERNKFRPAAGMKKWAPVMDKEVLEGMLGFVMRAWWTMDPQSVKAAIDLFSKMRLPGDNLQEPVRTVPVPIYGENDDSGSSQESDESE